MNEIQNNTPEDNKQYSYNEETRDTYRSMIAFMFACEEFTILPDMQKYWNLVFEYFTNA